MLKKSTFFLLFCGIFSLQAFAQQNDNPATSIVKPSASEIGVLVGLSNYQGDLIEPAFDLGESNFAFGAYYGYHFTEKFTGRLEALVATFSGKDADYTGRERRGYALDNSTAVNVSLGGDYYLIGRNSFGPAKNSALYLSGGFGLLFINPEPTGVPDGAEEEYPGSVFNLQIGGGVKQHFSRSFSMGLEFSYRPVFSDYVDGVSLTGNPDNNDTYFWLGLTAAFHLGGNR